MGKTTKTDAKPSPEDAVRKAVEKTPGATTEGIAKVAGVARSTAGKTLARLADAGELSRHQGGRDHGKRLPDRWTLGGVGIPPAFAGHVIAEPAAEQSSTGKPGKATDAKPPNESASDGKAAGDGKGDRLKPRQLEPLVLAYLKDNAASGPHGPTTVAKALERSSGAVGNCLVRLSKEKKVREVSDKPRRYNLAAGSVQEPTGATLLTPSSAGGEESAPTIQCPDEGMPDKGMDASEIATKIRYDAANTHVPRNH